LPGRSNPLDPLQHILSEARFPNSRKPRFLMQIHASTRIIRYPKNRQKCKSPKSVRHIPMNQHENCS
jgi:hypothetical protein